MGAKQPIPEDQIRLRAYEIYLQRGAQPGQEQEDWEKAVAELKQEKKRKVTAK